MCTNKQWWHFGNCSGHYCFGITVPLPISLPQNGNFHLQVLQISRNIYEGRQREIKAREYKYMICSCVSCALTTGFSLDYSQHLLCASWGTQFWGTFGNPVRRSKKPPGQPNPTVSLFCLQQWETSTIITKNHWNSRAVRCIYQIGLGLTWQKQHVLLFSEPTGVNTTPAAPELQQSAVYSAHQHKEGLLNTFFIENTKKGNFTEQLWQKKWGK